jgi:hypothetical protein
MSRANAGESSCYSCYDGLWAPATCPLAVVFGGWIPENLWHQVGDVALLADVVLLLAAARVAEVGPDRGAGRQGTPEPRRSWGRPRRWWAVEVSRMVACCPPGAVVVCPQVNMKAIPNRPISRDLWKDSFVFRHRYTSLMGDQASTSVSLRSWQPCPHSLLILPVGYTIHHTRSVGGSRRYRCRRANGAKRSGVVIWRV